MYTRTINLDGPAGNAYNLLATAKHMARDFGEDGKKIVNEMKESGDYDICLLYTSPSPRDLSTSRMPSSA